MVPVEKAKIQHKNSTNSISDHPYGVCRKSEDPAQYFLQNQVRITLMVSVAKKIKIQHNNSTTYVCTQHAGAQHICAQHTHKSEDQCKGGKPPTKRWTIEEDQGPPALSGRPLTQSGRPPTMRRSKAEGRQRSKGSAGSRHICECIKQTTARDANACECIPSGKPPQIRTHKAERRHRRMHTADIRLVCQMMKIVYGDRYSEKKLLRVFASDRFLSKHVRYA